MEKISKIRYELPMNVILIMKGLRLEWKLKVQKQFSNGLLVEMGYITHLFTVMVIAKLMLLLKIHIIKTVKLLLNVNAFEIIKSMLDVGFES